MLWDCRPLCCDFGFKQSCHYRCHGSYCTSVCLYLSRGTVGVLWSARMKARGGWWASSAGARAAPNPIILVFTPKLLNSWAGSMTLLRQTDFRQGNDQSQEVFVVSLFKKKKYTLTFFFLDLSFSWLTCTKQGYFYSRKMFVLFMQSHWEQGPWNRLCKRCHLFYIFETFPVRLCGFCMSVIWRIYYIIRQQFMSDFYVININYSSSERSTVVSAAPFLTARWRS